MRFVVGLGVALAMDFGSQNWKQRMVQASRCTSHGHKRGLSDILLYQNKTLFWTGRSLDFTRYHLAQVRSMAKRSAGVVAEIKQGTPDAVVSYGYRVGGRVWISNSYTCHAREECTLSAHHATGEWVVKMKRRPVPKQVTRFHVMKDYPRASYGGNFTVAVVGPYSIRVAFTKILWGYWWETKLPTLLGYEKHVCRSLCVNPVIRSVPDGWLSYHRA